MAGRKKGAGLICPEVKENVVHDYYYQNLSRYALAKKYSMSHHTADKILEECPKEYKASDNKLPLKVMKPLEDRSSLSLHERTELLKKDALSVMELVFQSMISILEDRGAKLTPTQLASIFSNVTPYVMVKVDGKKKVDIEPRLRLHNMFKEEVNRQSKDSITSIYRNGSVLNYGI